MKTIFAIRPTDIHRELAGGHRWQNSVNPFPLARPTFINSEKCLSQMFNGTSMLLRMNEKIAQASADFTNDMLAQSEVVSSRVFDAEGLSQGMPFIWKALDPQRSPYYLTI